MLSEKEKLDDVIAEKSIEKIIQIIQATLLNKEKPYEEAMEAFVYINRNFPEAIETYDSEEAPIVSNQADWSEDYFYEQKVTLNYNFSRERFEHIVAVAKHLEAQGLEHFQKRLPAANAGASAGQPQNTSAQQPTGQKPTTQRPTQPQQKPGSIDPKLVVGGVIAVAGILFLLSR